MGNGVMSLSDSLRVATASSISCQFSGGSMPASSKISMLYTTERTPAYHGMPYNSPSRVPASTNPSTKSWLRPSASTRSVRSTSAPASANSGVQVVPTSATSGVVPPAIAVANFSLPEAQGTIWTSRSAPVSSLKASATSSKNSVESGLVPSMIHTLRVCPSPIIPPLSPSPLGSPAPSSPLPPPHAASARTAPAAVAPVQIFLIFPPRKVSARGPETLYQTLVDDEIYSQRGRRAPMRAQKKGAGTRSHAPAPFSGVCPALGGYCFGSSASFRLSSTWSTSP